MQSTKVHVFLNERKKAGKNWAKSKTLLQNFLFLHVLSFWCITKDTTKKRAVTLQTVQSSRYVFPAKRVATLCQ